MLAGVCSGIGQRFNIDPNLVRIAVVVLSFFGGVGIAGYLAGLAVMPRQGNELAPVSRVLPFTRTWPFPVLAGVFFAVFMAAIGIANGSFSISFFPVAVVALVCYLVAKKSKRTKRLNAAVEPTPFERAAVAWQQRVAEHQAESMGLTPSYSPAPASFITPSPLPPEVPAVIPKRRPGWALAIGLSCVGVAGLIILAGHRFPPVAYAAVITLSLGLALLWTARTGRPKAMIGVAVASVMVTGLFGLLEMQRNGHIGWPLAVPEPVPAVAYPVGYSQSFADEAPDELEVTGVDEGYDFSELELDSDAQTKITANISNLTVRLPENIGYKVTWKVIAGEYNEIGADGEFYERQISVEGESDDSSVAGLSIDGKLSRLIEDQPTLTLVIEMRAGSLTVVRP
jgi:phage shock protein PspC (stress-responsive transcriptional regulator)